MFAQGEHMIYRLLSLLPEPVARRLKSLIGRSATARMIFNGTKLWIAQRTGTIASGPGKGLQFKPLNGRLAYLTGTVEEDVQAVLSSSLGEGDVFYDIGANIGFFSIIGARLVCGGGGHVYAFEPVPASARVAAENARVNGFDHVTMSELAISSRCGYAFMTSQQNYSETYRIADNDGIRVKCATLDHIVAEYSMGAPNLIKIDVEGHEIEVLNGARDVLRYAKPLLLIEVHGLGHEFIAYCEDTLIPLGYEVTRLDGSALTEKPIRYHLLAKPRAELQAKSAPARRRETSQFLN